MIIELTIPKPTAIYIHLPKMNVSPFAKYILNKSILKNSIFLGPQHLLVVKKYASKFGKYYYGKKLLSVS